MQANSLEEAIAIYKKGNKQSASVVLKKLIKQDPRNEAAWLWLSACLENTEQKEYCLRKVLEINPENQNAKTALQKLASAVVPTIDEILAVPASEQKQPSPKTTHLQPPRQSKPKKKRNWFITFLAFLGFLVLVYACVLGIFNNQLSTQQTTKPQSETQQSTEIKGLVVKAGTLSQYDGQFSKHTVVNVYKENGTLEAEREDDLKQLCLDWLYYRAKIMEYEGKGQTEKAYEARASFNDINAWLDEYNENDVQTMFSIIEKNKWSHW